MNALTIEALNVLIKTNALSVIYNEFCRMRYIMSIKDTVFSEVFITHFMTINEMTPRTTFAQLVTVVLHIQKSYYCSGLYQKG